MYSCTSRWATSPRSLLRPLASLHHALQSAWFRALHSGVSHASCAVCARATKSGASRTRRTRSKPEHRAVPDSSSLVSRGGQPNLSSGACHSWLFWTDHPFHGPLALGRDQNRLAALFIWIELSAAALSERRCQTTPPPSHFRSARLSQASQHNTTQHRPLTLRAIPVGTDPPFASASSRLPESGPLAR